MVIGITTLQRDWAAHTKVAHEDFSISDRDKLLIGERLKQNFRPRIKLGEVMTK